MAVSSEQYPAAVTDTVNGPHNLVVLIHGIQGAYKQAVVVRFVIQYRLYVPCDIKPVGIIVLLIHAAEQRCYRRIKVCIVNVPDKSVFSRSLMHHDTRNGEVGRSGARNDS